MAYQDPKVFEGRVVRIVELAGDQAELADYTFIDCQIKGPAVLVVMNGSAITNGELGGTPDAVSWEIPASRPTVIGAIAARNCTFDRCSFSRIGFAGPPATIQNFLAGVKKK